MDEGRNPFVPGAGTQPPELAGRDETLRRARIVLERIKAGRQDRSILLLGLRGVGKTVLLNKMQRIADDLGYLTLLIEAPEDRPLAELLAPPLRQILLRIDQSENKKQKLKRARVAIQSFASKFKVTIGDIGVEVSEPTGLADSGVLERDVTDLLVAVGEAAAEAGIAIALFIDELQYVNADELGAFFAAIHHVGQLNLPFIMIGAGLPQLAGLSGDAKSYAERLFSFQNIGQLRDADAVNAVRGPIEREGASISEDGMRELVRVTEGYPYFLQEWGLHTWNVAAGPEISAEDVAIAGNRAVTALDESFFRVRFDRLSKAEKEYLRAMAELGNGPHRSGDIAEMWGRPVQQVAPIRAKIIGKGMIYSPGHGDTAFTVPMFDQYMRRVMPTFTRHTKKRTPRKK